MFLMALLLPLFSLKMSADEEKAIIRIPITLEPEKNLTRSQGDEQIICHYHGMMTSIVTTFSLDLGMVNITITNCSTGESWYESFDSSVQTQSVIYISGETGFYEISYMTSSGDIYKGTLIL